LTTASRRVESAFTTDEPTPCRPPDLERRLALGLVHRDGDASTVVDASHAAVGEERHRDRVAVPGERLVDRVVDDLIDEVMQTAGTRGSDVHSGALAHRLETLENLNGIGAVLAFHPVGATGCLVDADFGLVLRGLAGHRGVAPSRLDRPPQSTR
jgi:hypothetical protein